MSKRAFAVHGAAILGLAVCVGCLGGQGSTDGGSGADSGIRDEQFVAGDDTTGSLSLSIANSSMGIGDTSPFTVSVQNASGEPVSNINVACDSEQGVAIIEPQTGYELTSSGGVMSGVIGCERPGSFQMVCRLSVGANRRKFAQVNCTGDIPAGFQGFPGAAGGGLGGGVQNNEDGDVRIVAAGFVDAMAGLDGSTVSSDASVDISRIDDCDGEEETDDPEPFTDTYANIKVENNLAELVRFTGLSFAVTNVTPAGADYASPRLALTGERGSTSASGGGGTAVINVPIFKSYIQLGDTPDKWVGNPFEGGILISNPSFQTVTFTLYGETASGQSVSISASTTVAFGSYNRCGASS